MKDQLANTGFITLDRKLQENWLWLSEPFSKAQAWIDLLFLANHKESSFFLRGIKIDVKRGQLARSEDSLSERWKWSRNKVRRFLKLLQTEQQIEQHTSNKINVIEVINYNLYQERNNKKYNKKTTDGTRNDTHTMNENNDNNENKIEMPSFIKSELWNDFVKMRKESKKPLTESMAKGCIKNLIKFEDKKQGNANLSLENSIAGGYQGLFEPKPSNHLNNNSNAPNLNADDRLIKSLEIITKSTLIDKISVSSSNKAVLHFKSKKDFEELGKIEKSKRDEIKKIISESLKTNDFEFKF